MQYMVRYLRYIDKVQIAIRSEFFDGLENNLSKVITVASNNFFSFLAHFSLIRSVNVFKIFFFGPAMGTNPVIGKLAKRCSRQGLCACFWVTVLRIIYIVANIALVSVEFAHKNSFARSLILST